MYLLCKTTQEVLLYFTKTDRYINNLVTSLPVTHHLSQVAYGTGLGYILDGMFLSNLLRKM